MTPPFVNNKPPPGAAAAGFVAWFSGEVRLDAGVQRVALAVSSGALSFLDILRSDGTVLVHCTAALSRLKPATSNRGRLRRRQKSRSREDSGS
jgi:hypothetical protein